MSPHDHHPAPKFGDLAYETFYSAAVGGLVVALFFLVVDAFRGQPLYTPTLLGSVLFQGADAGAVEGMSLMAVALFTPVHLAVFGVLGLVATGLVRWTERLTGGGFAPPALALFVLLEGGFLLFANLIVPGVPDVLGQGEIFMANVLAACSMTFFLRYAHGTAEAELTTSERRRTPPSREVTA
jgi:hypothetical protein